MKKSVVLQLLFIFIVWGVLSPPVCMPLYQKMLFFPDRGDATIQLAQWGLHLERMCTEAHAVTFKSGSIKLSGYFLKLRDGAPVALVSHGNGGNFGYRAALADALLKSGYSVFLYDYRGYGTSEGTATIKGVVADAVAAYDYLVSVEHIAPNKIVGYGESLGTGITSELSRQRPLAGLVLQSGFPSLTWVAHDRLWFTWLYPASWFDDLDCLAAVKSSHPPLLIIHGTDDGVFSTRYARVVYDRASGSKTLCIIKGMHHNLEASDYSEFQSAMRGLAGQI